MLLDVGCGCLLLVRGRLVLNDKLANLFELLDLELFVHFFDAVDLVLLVDLLLAFHFFDLCFAGFFDLVLFSQRFGYSRLVDGDDVLEFTAEVVEPVVVREEFMM